MSDDVVSPMLLLEFSGKDEQPTVRVRGHLTAETAGAFTTSLFASGYSFGRSVIIDISGVTRIDSEGMKGVFRGRDGHVRDCCFGLV